MLPVRAPAIDATDLYMGLAAKRSAGNRSLLNGASADIEVAYLDYVAADGFVATPARFELSEELRNALSGNYERLKAVRGDVYSALKLSASRCPMCGERSVSGLDHFLPRKLFPEFAILPANLVPACSDCNREKGTRYRDENDEPLFLHAYFSDLGGQQILHASVDISTGTALLDFEIVCPSTLDQATADRARRHFGALKLDAFYREKGEEEAGICAFEVADQLARHADPQEICEDLKRSARAAERRLGVNHWRPVTRMLLAGDEEFCSGACSPDESLLDLPPNGLGA